ncbi:MAG: DUF3187 family protein [Gemmatimonadales bacterium]
MRSISLLAVLVVLAVSPLPAQSAAPLSLPAIRPVNPVAESRSGLYFQPWVPAGDGWRVGVALDYGSAIEYNLSPSGRYLLDAEVMRLNVRVGRDLGPRYFAQAEAFLGVAGGGFLDGFFDWYHDLLGLDVPERGLRPHGAFGYEIALPDGRTLRYTPGMYLGDLRLSAGRRHAEGLQSVVSITLPTATHLDGYGRGTVSASLLNTLQAPLTPRLSFEGSLGLGATPTHGDLADYQNQLFGLLAGGFRYRLVGILSLYLSGYYHTPYYNGTGYPGLDRRELSLNYGLIFRTRAGHDFKAGMTEDLSPSGPAVDAVFQLGYRW